MQGVKYNYTVTRNNARNEVPAASLSLNRIRNHSLAFTFKGNAWTGNYNFGRSLSISSAGPAQRALTHVFGLAFDDLWGCQMSANYTGAFQQSGSQISTIFKLNKKVTDKTSYFLSWETLKNKTKAAGAVNTRNRFFELGVDLTF